MCASFNSTLWAKIEKKDETHEIGETNLEYIYSLADNVTKLSIQGGESFYGPEFVDFVDNFPNKENLILDVFTNTITADMKAIKRWNDECKTLLINASIDGVEEVFEYIRWPGKWSKAKRNLLKIYDIVGSNMRYFYAIQARNLSSIIPTLEFRNNNTPKSEIIFNLVEGPRELAVEASTIEERTNFIKAMDNYSGYYSQREEHDLTAVYNLCNSITTDNKLLKQRDAKDTYVDLIRTRHLEN
jgi:hypothetical protein